LKGISKIFWLKLKQFFGPILKTRVLKIFNRTVCGEALKQQILISATFYPTYFSLESPFKRDMWITDRSSKEKVQQARSFKRER
jgi:hypothetical protein